MSHDPITPRPVLSLFDAICVVVGAIVGVGIFFGPRDVAQVAGSAHTAMLAWGVGGVIALLGALTFAELGRMVPRVGGQYEILKNAYGSPSAFLYVFCNLTAVQAGAVAIIGIICADHVSFAVNGVKPGHGVTLALATVLIWALVATNVLGVRPGANVQDGTVVAKLLALAGIIALAALAGPDAADAAASGAASTAGPVPVPGSGGLTFGALFAAVTITLFSYGGWQQALWVGGQVRDAARNVPRAIVIGVAMVVAVYLGANWAYLDLLGYEGVRTASTLAAEAVSTVTPDLGARVAAAAVAVSAFGVLNAQFLTGPWLTCAMSRDGLFFAPFGRIHARFATPAGAIILLGVVATALMLGLGLERTDLLTTGVVVVDAAFFALTGFALVVLRRRLPAAERGRAWLVPVALVFGGLELLAIVGSLAQRDVRPVAISGLAWIAAAAVVYVGFFRPKRRVA